MLRRFCLLMLLFASALFSQGFFPNSGATNQPISVTLNWSGMARSSYYYVQVSKSQYFLPANIVTSTATSTDSLALSGQLVYGFTYYWRVGDAYVVDTNWTPVFSFTTMAPPNPTLVSPNNGAVNQPTSLTLTWNSVAGVAPYQAQVSTVATFTTTILNPSAASGTSLAIDGLSNGTIYYWQIIQLVPIWGGNAVKYSSIWSFTTIPLVPVAPTLVSPTNGAGNQSISPAISWGTVPGAATYGSQVSTVSTFASTVNNQVGLTQVAALVVSLMNSSTYYWKANATNTVGTSVWSGVWSFLTTTGPPSAPILVAPVNGATNQSSSPVLTWNSVAGASLYNVQVSTIATFTSTISNQSNLSATSGLVNNLENSTVYYWRANATNFGGSSLWSAIWSFATASPSTKDSCIVYYPFSGNTYDSSGNAINGVAMNGASFCTDRFGHANSALLLPYTGYVNVAKSSNLSIANVVSISVWVKRSAQRQEFAGILYKGRSGNENYYVSYDTLYKSYIAGVNDGIWHSYFTNTAFPDTGKWEYIVAIISASGVPQLYVNGQPCLGYWGPGNSAYSLSTLPVDTNSMWIGRGNDAGTNGEYFSGALDDIRIYNRALTVTEIGQLYSSSPTSTILAKNDAAISKKLSISNSGIAYKLPSASKVSVTLYDIQGRQVRQLVNATQNAGAYNIDLRREKITAGFYVVKFKAGSFIVQKRLTLMN